MKESSLTIVLGDENILFHLFPIDFLVNTNTGISIKLLRGKKIIFYQIILKNNTWQHKMKIKMTSWIIIVPNNV